MLLAILLAIQSCAALGAAAEDSVDRAVQLVNVVRFDLATLLGSQLAVRREAETGKLPREKSECFSAKSHGSLTPVVAKYLASHMSVAELETATKFYSTPTGYKFTQHGIVSFYRDYGFPTQDQLPTFSDMETRLILEFSKTSAGEKLMRQQLLRAGAQRGEFQGAVDALLRDCGI